MDLDIEIPGPLTHDRRSFDSDGRLTATECVLTRANVCPYLGREIPEYQSFGLDPDAIYQLYRDADALEAATPALNGKPLLIEHVGVSAADPSKMLVAGTVSDCRWVTDRIIGTVSVWDAEAIRAIESGALKDISCGYRYVPVMKAGTAPDGTRFDGRMAGPFEWNHVALVSQGRVDGAMVADRALRRVSHGVLAQIEAERDRSRAARDNSPLARAVPGWFRLP